MRGRKVTSTTVWRLVLIAVIACLAVFLVTAEKPWEEDVLESIAEREAAGKPWKIDDYATVYLWWAALGNLVVASGLLATAKWWARDLPDSRESEHWRKPPTWFWVGIVFLLVLGAWQRVPRLSHSFWNDEEYGFRTYVWGVAEVEEEGDQLEFDPVEWREGIFRNKANNHIFFTVLARFSQTGWEFFTGGRGAPFNEVAIRFLPFLAGTGSLVMVAWLLAITGSPRAGLVAGFFLALNPWHLRYSVEARGYAYVLLFGLLLMVILVKALVKGRWRHWLAYGGCQLALLLSFPAELYLLVTLNALVFAYLCLEGEYPVQVRMQRNGRFVVANVLAGMAFIQIMASSIPQVMAYVTSETYPGNLGMGWIRELWCHLCAGIPWKTSNAVLHHGTSFLDQMEVNSAIYPLTFYVLPILLVIGLLWILRREGRILFIIVLAIIGGGVIEYLHNWSKELYVHVWYEIHLIMGFAILVALGLEVLGAAGRLQKNRTVRSALPIAIACLFLVAYAVITSDARARIRGHERQPLRGVVKEVRGESPAWSADGSAVLTGSFGISKGMIKSYDPWNRVLKSKEDMEELIQLADESGKPLFIYLCGRATAMSEDPELLAIVEGSGAFERLPDREAFWGLEALFSYTVYQYVGNPP